MPACLKEVVKEGFDFLENNLVWPPERPVFTYTRVGLANKSVLSLFKKMCFY